MSTPSNDTAFKPRIHDPVCGTDAHCDERMKTIDDQFAGENMMSALATWEYQAWRNIKADAIHDERITAANLDDYHRVETARVMPRRNYLVGFGHSSPDPFSCRTGPEDYIAMKRNNLQVKYGIDLPEDSQALGRAWDAVSKKFDGVAETSEGHLKQHWLIELRRIKSDLAKQSLVPDRIRPGIGKRRHGEEAESEEFTESEKTGVSKRFRAKRPHKSTSMATQQDVSSDVRASSRLKSAARPKTEEADDDGGSDYCTAKTRKVKPKATRSRRDRKTPAQLAWMNKHFRKHMAETKKPGNWKGVMSLEFKKRFDYVKPHIADNSMKNYLQQMHASGQLETGLVCDEQFYKDDGNYPGKDGSKNHPKVQRPIKEEE
ncbi:hypothetical protein FKW77_000722 [Venturia effusa]|uniref:Uncharacterized protein n=1 Tax=Venturia effusa TaxID=50376 RepID=A0A517LGF1_9PEZI|nr:hypothetical protein FKW77_000722 [Venturia effusa]